MARRLIGREFVRGDAVDLRVDGQGVRGYVGDSIAAAAWVDNVRVLSRSLKYHRPRGGFCLEGHCGGCLMRIDGVPNLRACQTPCAANSIADAQNAFPSAQHDALGVVDLVYRHKLDHHTLMTAATPLNWAANKVVRHLSGVGTLPTLVTPSPPVRSVRVEVCVIGGGPAGLAAAAACANAGVECVLVDDQLELGGSAWATPGLGTTTVTRLVRAVLEAGVVVHARATAIGYFPEDGAAGILAVATPTGLVRVEATHWIWAAGGYAMNLPVPDNDRPGVLAARAVGRLLVQHGIVAGDNVVIVVGTAPACAADAASLATALRAAGATATVVAEADVDGLTGRGTVDGVDLRDGGHLACDVVAMAAVPAPASEGPRQHACAVEFDASRGGFRVIVDGDGRTSTRNVWACGDVTGYIGPVLAEAHGAHVGAMVADALGRGPRGETPL